MADKEQARASKFVKRPGKYTLVGKQDMNTAFGKAPPHEDNTMGDK
jgi:hypothetical protein